MELKLNDIVRSVSLNPNSAAHVLSQSVLPGMPRAGSQGIHRVFTVEQAYRLALCCLLVSQGLSLKNAVKVTRLCERWLTGIQYEHDDYVCLIIYDGDVLVVEHGDEHVAPEDGYYCLSERCTVQSYPVPLVEQRINLTFLHDLINMA